MDGSKCNITGRGCGKMLCYLWLSKKLLRNSRLKQQIFIISQFLWIKNLSAVELGAFDSILSGGCGQTVSWVWGLI